MTRLHWGCGPIVVPGWLNSDRDDYGQEHVGDILDGLPCGAGHFAGAVAHHALQALAFADVDRALAELRRVLAPGAILRLSVPDLVGAYEAWAMMDTGWPGFAAIAEPGSIDDKFCQYLVWGGQNRTIFTCVNLMERCKRVGFSAARRSFPGQTGGPDWLTDLDTRPGESIYVEARA